MPFFRSYQKVVYCQSIIAFNRFFHGQLYGTECHKPTHPCTDIRRVANIYIDLHVYKLILGLDTVQSIQMIRSIYIQDGPQKMQKLNE